MINKLKHIVRGFTLIETLVAVLILATAIAGPLTIASKGLTTALIAKDQTTAYYLAQDAVEYVRFARDSNRLKGLDWLNSSGASLSTVLTPCVSADGSASCYFDSLANNPSAPTACSGACPVMYFDPSNQYFTYNSSDPNTPSLYTRTVTITTPVGANTSEASLVVKVTWSDLPGVIHNITVRENLFNWQ